MFVNSRIGAVVFLAAFVSAPPEAAADASGLPPPPGSNGSGSPALLRPETPALPSAPWPDAIGIPRAPRPDVGPQRIGRRSLEEWRQAIDEFWGPGHSTATQLAVFRAFWDRIDTEYACFNNLEVNWDSLRAVYEPEVAVGVSRGRFAAILNHLGLALRETHTWAGDWVVNTPMQIEPGDPILWVGWYGSEGGIIGAAMTPLPDGSLLIYRAVPNHPLGLEAGDILLGYEGVPWPDLLNELLDAQLPLYGFMAGSSPSSHRHRLLHTGGMNVHLFETMDIRKHRTGEVLHLSTEPLRNGTSKIYMTEILPVPGVPEPNYSARYPRTTWGMIEGTGIAYVQVWMWRDNAGSRFARAIRELQGHDPYGLVVDFRMNGGGNMFLSNEGLALLFDTDVTTIGFARRGSATDRRFMVPDSYSTPERYVIHGDPGTFWDTPIAVLTGPGAQSSGDQVALRMKFHPNARFFGKSTSAAFNAPAMLDLGDEDFFLVTAIADAYLASDPGRYLTHLEFEVDENVWLTPDRVAEGKDDVLMTAMSWIYSFADPVRFSAVSLQAASGGGPGWEIAWETTSDEWVEGFRIRRTDAALRTDVFPGDDEVFPLYIRSYVDWQANPGESYDYEVAAVRPDGSEVRSSPISVSGSGAPGRVSLTSAPNPFRDDVELRFDVRGDAPVSLRIQDLTGRLVRRLTEERRSGPGFLSWDGRDAAGRPVASGIYWVRLETEGQVQARKILRIR